VVEVVDSLAPPRRLSQEATVLQVAAQMSDIQVVLSIGDNVAVEALGTIPSNCNHCSQGFSD
jgi:hypothetical protein